MVKSINSNFYWNGNEKSVRYQVANSGERPPFCSWEENKPKNINGKYYTQYDSQGKVVKEIFDYGQNDTIDTEKNFDYNEKGFLTKVVYHDYNDNMNDKTETWKYDEQNRVVEYTSDEYYEKSNVTYKYTEQGRIEDQTFTFPYCTDGINEFSHSGRIVREYDKQNNEIKSTHYHKGEKNPYMTTVFLEKNVTLTSFDDDNDGKADMVHVTQYYFGGKENWVTWSDDNADGKFDRTSYRDIRPQTFDPRGEYEGFHPEIAEDFYAKPPKYFDKQ